MKRILTVYLVREIVAPLLLGLIAFTFVLLIGRILKLVELVVTRGVPFLEIIKLFGLIIPTFLEMTVPMALLLGILLGLGRLSSDHEILALKATGVSPLQILWPIAAVALCISCLTLALTMIVRPAANQALKKEIYNIAKNRVGTALKEKVFNEDLPNILIYADEVIPPGNTSQGVLIVDRRNASRETVIFGRVALFLSDEENNSLSLKLFDGTVYEREKKRPGFSQTHFNTYDFKLDFDEALAPAQKIERGPKEMSLRRLIKAIRTKEERGQQVLPELMELQQRFSFSVAPMVFALLGVSLVMVPTRSRASRSWGLTLSLFWLLVYYALLTLGKALGERQILPVVVAVWLPNTVVALAAAYLFRKAVLESPLLVQIKLEEASLYLNRRFAEYRRRNS
ncbi:MAG: LPS export ABC transporter permease LptF [Deltaproteobacteria bacterium]|nr:LPS export ABC transporter permease LptF [Deltaproteobacteria bacterium]